MTADLPWQLSLDGLEARRVERATLLLLAYEVNSPERTAVVRDADGAFAAVPYEPSLVLSEALALSRDGRRMVSLCRERTGAAGNVLVVHTLADGSQARYAEGDDGQDLCAAFSPDGQSLAVLAAAEEGASEDDIAENLLIVDVLDLGTGVRRGLWSGPGLAPAERAVSWSPDGRFLAVVHLDPEEEFAVTVLDAAGGHAVHQATGVEALGTSQGSWHGDHELVLFPEEYDYDAPAPPTLLVDVSTGATRRPGTDLPYGCAGVTGSRVVGTFAPHTVGTADLDGGNPRLLLTHGPMTQVGIVDIAPGAASLP